MSVQQIIYRIVGVDAASPAFEKAGFAAERSGTKIGKFGKIMSVTAAATAGAAIGIGVESIRAATSFQASMTKISTQAGGTQKDVKQLSAEVLKLGTSTQQGPQELADALYHLKSVGLDNVGAMKALRTASDLAAVGGANLEDVTNAIAGAWRSGIRGAHSFGQAAATVNAILGAGNMRMQDFVEAIGTGILPSAKAFGLSLKQVGAALALMTDEGIPAVDAATRLRMSFSLLGAPSMAADKQLGKIGLTGLQLANAMRSPGGIIAAITLLKKHLDDSGLSAAKQSQILSRSFGGGRSSSAILTLLNNLDVLRQKQDQVNSSTGKYGGAVKAQQKTAAAQFAILRSQVETLGISIGQQLLPYLNDAAKWMVTNEPTVIRLGVAFAGTAAAVTGLYVAVKGIGALTVVGTKLAEGATAIRGFTAAATSAAAVQKTLSAASAGGIGRLAAAQLKLAAAARGTAAAETTFAVGAEGATVAMGGLTKAESAAAVAGAALAAVNPVVWAVAGAVAVGGLVAVLLRFGGSITDVTGKMAQQDGAVGFNAAGYRKLAAQTDVNWYSQTKLGKAIRDSVPAYESARFGATAYSTTVGAVNKVHAQATQTADRLDGALSTLQGQYALTRNGAEALAAKSGVTAQALAASGDAGQMAFRKVSSYAAGLTKAQLAAYQTTAASNAFSGALTTVSSRLLAGQSDLLSWRQAQHQARQAIDASTTGLKGNSAAAIAAKQAVLQSTQQAIAFAQQEKNTAGGLRTATGTIRDQIKWLQQHAAHSKFAAQEIDALRAALRQIKSKHVTLTVTATGRYTVNAAGTGGKRIVSGLARGGRLPGYGGGDRRPALLEDGETVVSKESSRRPFMLAAFRAAGVPGYAAGGVVGSYTGNPKGLGGFLVRMDNQTLTALEKSTAKATAAGLRSAQASSGFGVAGPGGGAPAANAALARKMFPSVDWPSWNYVEMREAGWNQYARNPSSGAYGIPQALPPSKMGPAANPPQSNPAAQISWMVGYMNSRYGGSPGAAAHERAYNWYAAGTRGARPGWAWVGERGPELVKFRGGETVLDHGSSKMAATAIGGYASGTPDSSSALVELGKKLMARKHTAVLNALIAGTRSRHSDDVALSTAPGLTAAQHSKYKALAASAQKHLTDLLHDKAAVSAYRKFLQGQARVYKTDIAVAKRHKLPGEAQRLGKLVTADENIIARINMWTAGVAGFGSGPGGPASDPVLIALGAKLMRRKHTGMLNTMIGAARKEHRQDVALSKAPGLSARQHRHFAALAAKAAHRVKVLTHDHDAVAAFRTDLKHQDRAYGGELAAAKAHHLTREAARLEKLIAANQKMISRIDMWTAGVAGFGDGPGGGPGGKGAVTKELIAEGRRLMRVKHTGVLGKQITAARTAWRQDVALSTAPGLTAAEHGRYKVMAAEEKKELTVLTHDLAAVRALRTSLRARDKTYEVALAGAKAHKDIKEAARLTRLLGNDAATVKAINMWTAGVATFPAKGTGTGGDDGSGDDGSGGGTGTGSTGPAPPPVITATDVASTLAQFMPFTTSYQFRRGTWSVPQTGPALVHAREMVLPEHLASAVREAIGNGSRGGGDMAQVVQLLGQLVGVSASSPAAQAEVLGRVLSNKARPAAPRPRYGGGPFGR